LPKQHRDALLKLTNALRLPPQEKVLALRAVLLMLLVRLALWLLPYDSVDRAVRSIAVPGRVQGPQPPLSRLVRAVERAARVVPASSCLTRALTAEVLLARRGYCPQLRLGVARGSRGEFEAHAWLDVDGATLVGASEAGRFTAVS
jgi:hypothetical protein